MKIVQVSSTDLVGKRFNGQYLTEYFSKLGHTCVHLVWDKEGHNPNTFEMLKYPFRRTLHKISGMVEGKLSIRGILHPYSFLFKKEKFFKNSDVAHFHIMYWPNFFSVLAYPGISRKKPTVLTVHDFWPFTGRCVYPFECKGWLSGCGQCPTLTNNFHMKKDHSGLMWKIKEFAYKRSKFDIVVASKFMYEQVKQSPLLKNFRIHHVPFGIDLNIFKPSDSTYSKHILGIGPDEIVISFRAAPGDFKGLEHIKEALKHIKTDKKICLLTFNNKWQVEEFRSKYKIIDLGWVNDEGLTLNAYNASDFFLMPSTQEAFGMMAMEAMAFGKPVVVFSGTSLPEVVGGPECGIVVPMGNCSELAKVVEKLVNDVPFREERGRKALKFAQDNYSLELHMERLVQVYETAIENF